MEDVVALYHQGAFNRGGRPPKLKEAGDWIKHCGYGRTLYLGARGNGKFLRIYEKGKQLGDRTSPWIRYEVELHSNQLSSSAGSRYVELLSEAVRVRYDETTHLRDVSEAFYSGDFLRASAFASQLREQLKTKFGSRWWTSHKAGDYLIDLWNTGGRYKVEEMAKMIDLGDLSYDWLAEE